MPPTIRPLLDVVSSSVVSLIGLWVGRAAEDDGDKDGVKVTSTVSVPWVGGAWVLVEEEVVFGGGGGGGGVEVVEVVNGVVEVVLGVVDVVWVVVVWGGGVDVSGVCSPMGLAAPVSAAGGVWAVVGAGAGSGS
jgi:hypothetical protein